MRAVLMAGGRGTRMGDPQKCLRPVCGIPLLFRVAGVLHQLADEIYVVTTPGHVELAQAAERWGLKVIYGSGLGYPQDFPTAARLAPAVVAACDIADLEPRHIQLLATQDVFATAVTPRGYVGLSYLPSADMDRWVEVDVGSLLDVDTPEDLEEAERRCPTAYPLYVDVACLKPHEETLDAALEPQGEIPPIAVDYRTGVVLDGHHRLKALLKHGSAPALLFDYQAVDVNIPREEVVQRALEGRLYPPKTTWHTYRGKHISQIPAAKARPAAKKLRCRT
ncbi:NTP transferase domain-containing protein [Pyrobaculum neutrophilum]|nr:NTP transferase domain-containing protein [Pyrobaculum neutrophilum]